MSVETPSTADVGAVGSRSPTVVRSVEFPILERHSSPSPADRPSASKTKLIESGFLADLVLWYCMNRSVVGHSIAFLYVLTLWIIMFECCKPYYFVFFAYLTNWGLTMSVFYFFCGLVHDTRRRLRRRILFFGTRAPPALPPLSSSALLVDSPCEKNSTPKSTAASESTCDASIFSPNSSGRSPCDLSGVVSPVASTVTQRASSALSQPCYCTYYDPSSSLSSLWWKIFHQTLGELTFVVQVVIVTFFWVVVFPHEPHRPIWWECQTHGMPLVLMMLDYAYRTFHRFSLRNMKWVLLFGVTFLFCHMCLVLSSGKPIYPGISFKDIRSFMISLSAICMLVTTHKVVYLFSNWDRIKREVKSLIGLLYVIMMGMEGTEVSPLISLWNTLSTKTNLQRRQTITGTSSGRTKKWWWTYVYGQSMPSDGSRIFSAYTAKWSASSPSSMEARCLSDVPISRLVKRKSSAHGSQSRSGVGDTADVYDELRSKPSTTDDVARVGSSDSGGDHSLMCDYCKSGSDVEDAPQGSPARATRRRTNLLDSLSGGSSLGGKLTSRDYQSGDEIVSKEIHRPLTKYRSHSHDFLDMLEAEASANFGHKDNHESDRSVGK
eukprot:GHVS01084962.1.p1 GENE.GHVS01084962.1~~GHVS01084962.1.p1  ORF type:complete len:606 (+),score=34.62 GHVS01084962.1:410-2227(+)